MRPIRRIILHHSDSPSTTPPREIEKWHRARGFDGIGYHFLFWRSGSWRWDAARPVEKVGAHDAGENLDSIGVCFVGDWSRYFPSEKALDLLSFRLAQLCLDHGLSHTAVRGHREDGNDATECPGLNIDMDSMRTRVEVNMAVVRRLREAAAASRVGGARPLEFREHFEP